MLLQCDLEGSSDRVFTRVVQTSEQDCEALLRSGWVRLSENLHDTGVREPIWDRGTGPQTLSELGTGDVGGWGSLGNLVDWLVLVGTWEVGHGLEWNHLNVELVLELGDEFLGIVLAKSALCHRSAVR